MAIRPEAIIPKILPIILSLILLHQCYYYRKIYHYSHPSSCYSQQMYAAQCRFLLIGGRLHFSLHGFVRSDGIRAHSQARTEVLGGKDWGGSFISTQAELSAWVLVSDSDPPSLCMCAQGWRNVPRFPSYYSRNIPYSGNNSLRPNDYSTDNDIISKCG